MQGRGAMAQYHVWSVTKRKEADMKAAVRARNSPRSNGSLFVLVKTFALVSGSG